MSFAYMKKYICKTNKKHIWMYNNCMHVIVDDVWILDDNTIYPYRSVICDTTLTKVHHIEVCDWVMKAMHVTTTTWLHIQQIVVIDDAKPQCELLVDQVVVSISSNHRTYFNNSSNQLNQKYKQRAEYIQCGIHRNTYSTYKTWKQIHMTLESWKSFEPLIESIHNSQQNMHIIQCIQYVLERREMPKFMKKKMLLIRAKVTMSNVHTIQSAMHTTRKCHTYLAIFKLHMQSNTKIMQHRKRNSVFDEQRRNIRNVDNTCKQILMTLESWKSFEHQIESKQN